MPDVGDDGERDGRAAARARCSRSGGPRRSRASERPKAAERLPFPHSAPRPDPGEADGGRARRRSRRARTSSRRRPRARARRRPRSTRRSWQGLATGRQVVFLTSKTLQQKMAVSALVAMNERAFHTLQVRAKEKMCANDRILCHEEFCRFAKDYPEKMAAFQHPRAAARRLLAPRPARRVRGGAARGGLSLRGAARARVARRRDRRRLQLRLRAGRRAAAPDGRGPRRTRSCSSTRRTTCPDRARQIFSPEILEEDLRGLAQPPRAAAGRALRGHRRLDRGPPRDARAHAPRSCPRGTRSRRSCRRPTRSERCARNGSRSCCATSPGSARRGSPWSTTR